jgi:hypothetical protein
VNDGDPAGRCLTVNRKRMQRLMRWMGIAALGPGPEAEDNEAAAGPQDLSLLQRDAVIDQPN